MKKFRIQIIYCGYSADFMVTCEDTPQGIENAILDKLGEKSIVWEKTGMFSPLNRITYEEVVDDTRPVQSKKVLGVEVATGV